MINLKETRFSNLKFNVNIMQHGHGKQSFLTKSYQRDRRRALEDRTRFTHKELMDLEVTESGQGAGATDSDKYKIWQHPYPIDQSVRQRKKVDIRIAHPNIGY